MQPSAKLYKLRLVAGWKKPRDFAPFWVRRIVPFGYNMIAPFGQNSIAHLLHLLL